MTRTAWCSPALVVGETADIQVTASVQGSLNAWFDWNADGDWDDAGEHVFVDNPLTAGVNRLTLAVPAKAVAGETFARFRFSTVRGLGYKGPAADGEVEDYMVRIEDGLVPVKPPLEHLKWSQPPIEYDPDSQMPVYCGWDQPAYVSKPLGLGTATWRLVADDFRCIGRHAGDHDSLVGLVRRAGTRTRRPAGSPIPGGSRSGATSRRTPAIRSAGPASSSG